MLEVSHGLKSICTDSGATALSKYQERLQTNCCKRKFKLVLTDIQMPNMDGFELCKKIKVVEQIWKAR